MATFSLSAGCLTGSELHRSQSSCAPAQGSETLADFIFNDRPTATALQPISINPSLDKFSVTFTTAHQSYHRNQQYSIVAVTDDTGAIIERYAYTAYGVPTFFDGSGSPISDSAISNRYTYTGREYDSIIRLYHYRARMYDPQLGRFLGRDPIGYEGSPWNLYEYVKGQPTVAVDPTGLVMIICHCLEGSDFGITRRWRVEVDCTGRLAVNCCGDACRNDCTPGLVCFSEDWDISGAAPDHCPEPPCSLLECLTGCAVAAASANFLCDLIPEARAKAICKYGVAIGGISCGLSCRVRCTDP